MAGNEANKYTLEEWQEIFKERFTEIAQSDRAQQAIQLMAQKLALDELGEKLEALRKHLTGEGGQ